MALAADTMLSTVRVEINETPIALPDGDYELASNERQNRDEERGRAQRATDAPAKPRALVARRPIAVYAGAEPRRLWRPARR